MPAKVKFVLDDDVKADLDRLVESGQRNRLVNDALRRELGLIRRQRASARLDDLRARARHLPERDVVRLIRRDRGE